VPGLFKSAPESTDKNLAESLSLCSPQKEVISTSHPILLICDKRAKIVLSERQSVTLGITAQRSHCQLPQFLKKRMTFAFGNHGSPNVRVVHSSPLGKLLRDNAALHTHSLHFQCTFLLSVEEMSGRQNRPPSPLGELLCKDALHARFTNCLTVFRSLGWLALRPREGHYDSRPCSKKGTYRS
jgi:hypothetical protein